MGNCSMIKKVYVRLNTDKIISNIEHDVEATQIYNDKKSKYKWIRLVISIILWFALSMIFSSVSDKSIVGCAITAGILSCIAYFLMWLVLYFALQSYLNYNEYNYDEEFINYWSREVQSIKYNKPVEEVINFLVNLPSAGVIIENAKYIRIVLKNTFLCVVEDKDGTLISKDTGEQLSFYIDISLLNDKQDIVEDNDLIVIITEQEHFLIDTVTYNSDSFCEICDEVK